MRLPARVSQVAVAALLSASLSAAPPLSAQRGPVARHFPTDSFYIRDWIRGSAKEPDLFVEPREVAVTRTLAVVFDAGTREVHALDLNTGAKRFVLSATGEGPGEFKRPIHIATTPDLIGVLDAATSRVSVYSDAGRFLWTTRVPDGGAVEAMCLLPRGRVRVKFLGAVNAIATIDSSGRTLTRTSLPVPAPLRQAPTFANAAYIADGCDDAAMMVIPYFGPAWYRVSDGGAARRFLYAEPGLEAVVTSTVRRLEKSPGSETRQERMTTDVSPIARGAMQRGDTVIIEAGATKRLPYELLDYYRAGDGTYLYSRHLPFTPNALAITPDGRLIATIIGEESSSVLRLSTTTLSPREYAKQRRRQ
ncbi:MAG: hypothetical protein P3B76_10405 [Gemmatimonadota bacterium]|nr:hypothetical protein [Gemmatimonadota bacterium]MDQ8168711.1 hypothetical protein [Gemmatimonadota bacterium]MDQ8173081.1 hypothetical protein [Gemmatimonadota bacterium]